MSALDGDHVREGTRPRGTHTPERGTGGRQKALDTWSRGLRVATPTGLEPAASAVTGRRANQLRYGAWMVLNFASSKRSHGMLTHTRVASESTPPPTGFEPVLPP